MLKERSIKETWVKSTLEHPERVEHRDDGTVHFIKAINKCGGKYLRVIVNPNVQPQRIVTVFFDRRQRRVK
ncbi:MAG: hypothetical protein COW32_00485 [Candidatus Aquicultor secundus]|uniref:DUF4258 domain-containing protein n=1 Tax=Candidatus Aquicultor secundus TaxID=1973895 RepID=A0A2M7T5T8_9ACTN|nr:DUF4258 domain-containing protein [Candidatus Aquicultor secundus]NCO66111.1 DUF4258 domain-containing protein [Solirubrobacter sp.]OIO85002.1 MAG: hypothetical protein AUK32_07850 [Candidatus Aquicultor secundus]PIU28052.1 MAG: hypothetical protein COT10_00270 [Candidatus Aquicultor secundus]PIW23212.1 MAG: hypothetical protein COW32_00485 [Candidatus Aquicultor secundus]PIX51326.1 MAG: hypothetical protein COZ51_10245 [Candidatus Aquicultor secundus]